MWSAVSMKRESQVYPPTQDISILLIARSQEGVGGMSIIYFPHSLCIFIAAYCWLALGTYMAALHLIVRFGFNCILSSIHGRASLVILARIPPLWTPSKSQTSPSICFPGLLSRHISMLSLGSSWLIMYFLSCTKVCLSLGSSCSLRLGRVTWTSPLWRKMALALLLPTSTPEESWVLQGLCCPLIAGGIFLLDLLACGVSGLCVPAPCILCTSSAASTHLH